MTDPILPDDLANGLVDGTADVSSLPMELRGVAGLFAAAHQPATGAELAGMAAAMEQFTAAISGATLLAATAASTPGVISMFGTRVTKRAAMIVGATLLVAGTAAAAAGGVIPTPFTSDQGSTHTTLSVEPSGSNSTSSSVESTETSIADSNGTPIPAEDVALCLATTTSSSAGKSGGSGGSGGSDGRSTSNAVDGSVDGSVDGRLARDASSRGRSVNDFCTEAERQNADDHGTDVTGSSIDDHGNDTASSVDTGSGKGGTGGHGVDDPMTSVSTANSSTVTTTDVSGKGGSTDTTA